MSGKVITISLKLFIITAVAALCLAFVNKVTAPIIEENAQKTKTEALNKVLPDAKEFGDPETIEVKDVAADVEEIYVGTKDAEVVGYVVTAVSHDGYGGDIRVMVGIDKDLKVTKIEILESSETAGLGANASQPKFAGQFEGKSGELSVVKGAAAEGQISAISSATVTSKAVTNCVNAALKAAEQKVAAGMQVAENAVTEESETVETEDDSEVEADNDSGNEEDEVTSDVTSDSSDENSGQEGEV